MLYIYVIGNIRYVFRDGNLNGDSNEFVYVYICTRNTNGYKIRRKNNR